MSTEAKKNYQKKSPRKNIHFLFFLFAFSFFLFSFFHSLILPYSLLAQSPHLRAGGNNTEEQALQPFNKVIENTQKLSGLFTLYTNKEENKAYLEIQPEQLNKKFLCFITLESGLGESGILSGLPIGDYLFQLRRQQNNVQFALPNINFRTQTGDPQASSVERSFSDSILYSLPIKSIHPERKSLLIDLGDLLMSEQGDLPGITPMLPYLLGASYLIDPSKSYFKEFKVFPLNVEISSVYGFSSSNDGMAYIPSLPDSRAFNLRIHYSFSEVPINNGYQPRTADERVGYFLTAYKDFSETNRAEPFVRYINRWQLQKQNPFAPVSPPIKPIVFWIENTVPMEYREAIKEGILAWNKAFEKAGFINAIEVKQMPDNASWDPADVRYNTIRWSSSFEPTFAGIGPSRVNPLTGQILDADIVLDADVVRQIKSIYRGLVRKNQSMAKDFQGKKESNHNPCQFGIYSRYLKGLAIGESATADDLPTLTEQYNQRGNSLLSRLISSSDLCFGLESSKQLAIGMMSMSVSQNGQPDERELNEFVNQYLRYLTAHEVGHTLGLRHNFHGSTLLKPEDLNNTEITRSQGLVGSVMDYVAVNIAPEGVKQGDYFPVVVGPYDEWAIEYGYQPITGVNPELEMNRLAQIAQRAPEPALSYAADEDAVDLLDPAVNVFDLSSDILRYSQWQLDVARGMWNRLAARTPSSGEGYSELRAMFDLVFGYYFQNVMNTTLYIGGQSFNRDRPGDPNGRMPFEAISLEKQREALATLQKYVFAADAFSFSPELLNKLAPSRWDHWGNPALIFPLDYPIGDRVTFIQRFVLRMLLSPVRLTRLRDAELKNTPENTLKMPELLETLKQGIWTEVLHPNNQPMKISNFRRSLQREHLSILMGMVLRKTGAPEDARALAWSELRELRESLSKAIRKGDQKVDDYTRVHLQETRDRITKALNSQIQSN